MLGARVTGGVGGLPSEGQRGSQGDAGAGPMLAAPRALARAAPQLSSQSPSLSDTRVDLMTFPSDVNQKHLKNIKLL